MSSNNRKRNFNRIKLCILISVILLLVLPINYAKEGKIEKEIYSKANSSNLVRVTIKFEENRDTGFKTLSRPTEKKNLIKKLGERKIKHNLENEVVSAFISRKDLELLENSSGIESVKKEEILHTMLTESVPLINASYLHDLRVGETNLTGNKETVCVIDTGVDYTHSDLGNCTESEFLNGNCNKVIGGYDYCADDTSCDTTDSNPLDVDEGHGTHVAGTIAANEGLSGVAPGAKIVAMKACNSSGSCALSDIKKSIDWCVNNASEFNISAISISIGTSSTHSTYCDEDYDGDNNPPGSTDIDLTSSVNNTVSNNISVVIASGNGGDATGISAPACIEKATPVGATYKKSYSGIDWSVCTDTSPQKDDLVCIANRAPEFSKLLLAPGALINSTTPNGEYGEKGGTSMAAPHVSGAIALLLQYKEQEENQTLAPSQLTNALNSTGKLIYDSESGKNYSRINLYSALLSIDEKSPQVNISSPLEDQEFNSVSNISLNFTTFDTNLNSSACKYSLNDEANISISNCKNTTFNVSSEGNYNLTLYSEDYSSNLKSSTISFQVNLGPSIELLSPPNNSILSPGSLINFNITDEDNITSATYSGTKNGGLTNSTNTTWYINTSNWSTGEYNLTISANDTLNNTATSNYTFQLNYAPNISQPTMIPSTAYTSTDLSANTTYTDANNDSGTVYFKWYVNGTNSWNQTYNSIENGTQIVSTFNSSNYQKRDLINCSVYANDSFNTSPTLWSSNTINISNSNVTFDFPLSDKNVSHSQNLTYNINCSDPDYSDGEDNITYYDNTSLFEINSSTGLIVDSPNQSEIGNYSINITCGDGSINTSQTFTYRIENHNPELSSPQFNDTEYHTSEDIKAKTTYTDRDPDEGTVYFKWYVNGSSVSNQASSVSNGSVASSILRKGNYSKNDTINLTVYATDSSVNTSTYCLNITISNHVPTIPLPLSPENSTTNTDNSVDFSWNNSIDYDGENITYFLAINSSANSTISIIYNGSDTNYSSYSTSDGVDYYWKVRSSDNHENSSWSKIYKFSESTETDDGGSPSSGGVSAISTSEDDSDSVFSKTQVFNEIKKGESKSIEIDNQKSAVSRVVVSSQETLKSTEVTVSHLKNKPKEVSEPPQQGYAYLSIKGSSEKVEGSIKFRVNRTWLETNKLDASNIHLAKYSEEDWKTLDTEVVGESTNYVYYKANSEGFSYFAILGEREPEKEEGDEKETEENLSQGDTEIETRMPKRQDGYEEEDSFTFEILIFILLLGIASMAFMVYFHYRE